MSPQTLNALGFCARVELNHRARPSRVSLKATASKAALAASHASGVLDGITDPELREIAALAWAALEYVQGATVALERAELLAAARGEEEAA